MNNDERRNDSQNGNHARRTYSLTEIAKHLDRPLFDDGPNMEAAVCGISRKFSRRKWP
ncbi:hypothetical protein [Halobacillus halophilus]|uniref:hypothetical protein n=1 Tax=Halobacillus halophilus TaxID=1570 RepID=UPI00166F7A56|nr:hypothetical protein [Halobacillus halophilus]